jgi:hypothetical protein
MLNARWDQSTLLLWSDLCPFDRATLDAWPGLDPRPSSCVGTQESLNLGTFQTLNQKPRPTPHTSFVLISARRASTSLISVFIC